MPYETMIIQDILMAEDNFTFTELQNLDDETVQIIFQVKTCLNRGQKMKEKTQAKK